MKSRRLMKSTLSLLFSSILLPVLAATTACKGAPEPAESSQSSSPVAARSVEPAAARPSEPSPAEEKTEPVPDHPKSVPAPDDVAAPPKDAKKTASGLAYKVLQPSSSKERPGPSAKVKVNYTGWTTDGKMFDSTSTRNQPAEFRIDGVIKGWTEGLQLMAKGEKTRFWIPAAMAYGEKATRPGMPSGMLVFDIELLDFAQPPAAPPDVKAPPATAKRTESGLAYRVLQKGTGTRHPAATDRVRVHYTGWTTDGKAFDSSITNDVPLTISLGNVIKGWTEGLQLMVEGEKARFWIPAALAYGDKPSRQGAPSGMLVFDIELLAIP